MRKYLVILLVAFLLAPMQAMAYTVKKHENLTQIAKANNTTVSEIVSDNGIKDKNLIYVGQELSLRNEALGFTNPTEQPGTYVHPDPITIGTLNATNGNITNGTFTTVTTTNFNLGSTKATTTYGSELLVDGGVQVWTSSTVLTNWIFTDFSLGGTGATLNQSATTTGPSSTYSAKLQNNNAGSALAALTQAITCNVGDYISFGGYFASETATNTVNLMGINASTYASSTKIWDSASSTWKVFDPALDMPTVTGGSITNTFSLVSEVVTCPTSSIIAFSVLPNAQVISDAVVYADNMTSFQVNYPPDITVIEISNPSDVTRMEVGDKVWNFITKGGTSYSWFYQDGFGKFGTDMSQFDLTTKPTLVKTDSTNATSALNGENGVKLLNTIEGIDLVNTVTTSIFTAPAGYKILNPELFLEITAVDAFSTPANGSVGVEGYSYTDISSGTVTLSNLDDIGETIKVQSNTGLPINRIVDGDLTALYKEIFLIIGIPAVATTLTADAYLFGTLIPS